MLNRLEVDCMYFHSDGTLGERQQELFPGADGDGYYLGEVVLLVYTPSIYFTQTPASTQNYRNMIPKELNRAYIVSR